MKNNNINEELNNLIKKGMLQFNQNMKKNPKPIKCGTPMMKKTCKKKVKRLIILIHA